MALIDIDKTREQICKDMLDEVPEKYQKSVGFFIWDTFMAISTVLMQLWDALKTIAGYDDLSNMSYNDLVRFVFQRRGIIAKEATFANGLLTVVTGSGTINKGDLFETASGLQFVSTATVTVNQGDTFNVECLTSGIAGNVPPNSITVIPRTIQGVVAVTNENAFTGGYDAETKEALLQRYLDDLQKPITSGNIFHYKKWALEVAGVGKADVKPLWNGDNTVKVIIVDTNSEIAPQSLVDEVQEYIDTDSNGKGLGQAPIGAYCTVTSGDTLNIDVSVEINLKAGATLTDAKNSIEREVKSYLKSIVFDDNVNYVSYALIGASILRAEEVLDYQNLLLNNDTDNVPIANTTTTREIAVLDELTVTEI